jgi:glycosyltransferase involved in cell wall biosynthesis
MLAAAPVSEQPNLLLCCFDLIPGPSGLSRRITEYLKGLSEKFQVVVLSAKTPDVSHIERFSGARLLRVPVGSGDLASRIQAFDRAVRRQMESEEFAIVHCFDPFGGYALCELKTDYGYRFIYDASAFPSHELRWSHPDTENDRRFLARIRRQELYCLMNADRVITGSETTRKYIAGLGVATEAISIIPAPVDLAPYTAAAMGRPDASPMKLIYLGSQLGYQGLTTLLRGMQLALRQTDVRLTIVGPRHTEWQPALEDLIDELKLKGKVEFQPPVAHDDVHKIIALADAGVLPLDPVERNTVQGGALSKVAEYLAGGRPVIASDLEVTRELIPEGAGTFFPAGDYKALAEVIVSLGTHPEQRVAMGSVASAVAKERFDGAKARARLLELYGAQQLAASRQVDDRGEPTRSAVKAMKAIAAEKDRKPPQDAVVRVVLEAAPKEKDVDDRTPTAITDPASSGKTEPPVVMGLPLREEANPATTAPSLPPVPDRPTRPPQAKAAAGPIPSSSQARAANPLGATALPASGSQPRPALPKAPAPLGGTPITASASQPRPAIPAGSQARAANPLAAPAQAIPAGSQARAANPLRPPAAIPTASQARAANPLTSPPPPIPQGSQVRASNPLLSPPPIPMGSQARASNPLLSPPPIPMGSQARAANPLQSAAPAPIPTGSQPRGRGPLSLASSAPGPSASQPKPKVVDEPSIIVGEELQPSSDKVRTDKRIALGMAAVGEPATPAAMPALDDEPLAADDDVAEADDGDISEADEVSDADEVSEADDGDISEADEVLSDPATTLGESMDEEPPEAEADAALEGESHELEAISTLDPWLAQLVHGWCPPDAGLFTRLPPPTTFPGRENPPTPSRP